MLNKLLFETLERIYPIESSRVNTWSLQNKYNYPPFFRFRFQGIKKDDKIYADLKHTIESFKGLLKWKLITNENTLNYLIVPEIFVSSAGIDHLYDRTYYEEALSKEQYEKKVDKAIEDITGLATHIANSTEHLK